VDEFPHAGHLTLPHHMIPPSIVKLTPSQLILRCPCSLQFVVDSTDFQVLHRLIEGKGASLKDIVEKCTKCKRVFTLSALKKHIQYFLGVIELKILVIEHQYNFLHSLDRYIEIFGPKRCICCSLAIVFLCWQSVSASSAQQTPTPIRKFVAVTAFRGTVGTDDVTLCQPTPVRLEKTAVLSSQR
jgi:hypothetical protein